MSTSTNKASSFMYGYQSHDANNSGAYHLADRPLSYSLHSVLTQLSDLATTSRVLDLGCGDGILERHATRRDYSFTSIDLEPSAIESLRSMFALQNINPDDIALVGDVTRLDMALPFNEPSFDAAVSWRVLHGINPKHYKVFFKDMHKLLKPGARFFMSVACDKDWKASALGSLLNRSGVNDCAGVMFRDYGIDRSTPFPVHFFNKNELTALGKDNGFRLKSVEYFQETSGYNHLKDKKNTYLFAEFIKG